MKVTIILSTNNGEKNWNAFRLANLALKNEDNVSVFLIGEGVEYLTFSNVLVAGLLILGTGLVGFCVLYKIFGISTLKKEDLKW